MTPTNPRSAPSAVASTVQNAPQAKFGPADKILSALEAKFVIVQATDRYGTVQATTYLQVGNDLYLPPESLLWTSKLTRIAGKKAAEILKRVEEVKSLITEPSPSGTTEPVNPLDESQL